MTSVADALKTRISVRAFLDKPVSDETIGEILEVAKLAPSGGNLQPWKVHVVTGAARARLVETVKTSIAENPFASEMEIAVYPDNLWEPFRTRRFAVGEQMYGLVGIPREDKAKRLEWFGRNFEFFGAPVGLFFAIDRRFDRGQWAHLGMFMQSIALLAVEKGLGSCMQECWAMRARSIAAFLGVPNTEMIYCGMALGYPDPSEPVNRLRSARAGLEEFVTFHKG
jgi:nitroreductase